MNKKKILHDSAFIEHSIKITKTETVYFKIREQIINNELKPGTQLIERKLCESLNSSRTPIREALKRLANEELVDFLPGQRAVVSYITYENIVELYDIREALEGLAVRRCTENIDEYVIKELEIIVDKFEVATKAKDIGTAMKMDIEFHSLIMNETKNFKLKKLIMSLSNQSNRITNLTRYDKSRASATLEQHRKVLDAIRKKDANAAEKEMKEHIKNSKKYHLSNLNKYKFIT